MDFAHQRVDQVDLASRETRQQREGRSDMEAYWFTIKDGEMTVVKTNRDPFIDHRDLMRWPDTTPIPEYMFEYFPTEAWAPPRKHPPTPWVRGNGIWAVSEAVKQAIEALEPNVHQFIPLTVKCGTRASHVDYQYYSLRINQRIDDVLVERSDVNWESFEFKGKTVRSWRKKTAPLVLPADSIRGKHLWWNKACALALKLVSGELYRSLEQNKLTKGLRVQKQIVES